MAKRDPKHPALRGYQVCQWISKGILKARPLFDTPILIVQEAKRVRLTREYRTTLSQGIFLVPRWIKAPEYERERFFHLSAEELKEKGIIREEGVLYLLIYQQIEDIDHLLRQQHHIIEQSEITEDAEQTRILFDGKRTKAFDRFVKPEIEARKEAALRLKRQRTKQLQTIRTTRLVPLLGRLGFPEMPIPNWELEGMVRYLDGIIAELDEIIERPPAPRRKRAQESLRAVQRQIQKRNFYLARKRLKKALENLTWPSEER